MTRIERWMASPPYHPGESARLLRLASEPGRDRRDRHNRAIDAERQLSELFPGRNGTAAPAAQPPVRQGRRQKTTSQGPLLITVAILLVAGVVGVAFGTAAAARSRPAANQAADGVQAPPIASPVIARVTNEMEAERAALEVTRTRLRQELHEFSTRLLSLTRQKQQLMDEEWVAQGTLRAELSARIVTLEAERSVLEKQQLPVLIARVVAFEQQWGRWLGRVDGMPR